MSNSATNIALARLTSKIEIINAEIVPIKFIVTNPKMAMTAKLETIANQGLEYKLLRLKNLISGIITLLLRIPESKVGPLRDELAQTIAASNSIHNSIIELQDMVAQILRTQHNRFIGQHRKGG